MNIEIFDIINELDEFAHTKASKKLLTFDVKSTKENITQEDLFKLFSSNLKPEINNIIIEADEERKKQAFKQNTPEALQASMSFNFVDDVMVYSQYYLQQLDFSYYLKTGKNLFIVSNNSDKFLAPVSMIFHITNFLAFTSFKAIDQLYQDLRNGYEILRAQGYCSDDENDPNLPSLRVTVTQSDSTFSLECPNNFLSINAPMELKQQIYFLLIHNFIKKILEDLNFEFVEINKHKEQDYIDIYSSFMDSRKQFLMHMVEQFRHRYI